MMMSPRSLFAVEDDGLIKQLDFSDNETDDIDPSAIFASSPINNGESRPTEGMHDSSVNDEDLNSSNDSIMSIIRRPVIKQRPRCNVDTTPPYRKVRELNLHGSPQSPKTILKRSELSTLDGDKTKLRLFALDRNQNSPFERNSPATFRSPQLEANINPFCKSEVLPTSLGKRRRENGLNRTSLDESSEKNDNELENEIQPTKRIHLRDNGTSSRYYSDFLEIEEIGSGMFGSVYRCIHRMDGITYAIKKSKKPSKGTADERRATREVYAHAVLGHHEHVVRYYSAWAEDGHMFIQNEYCSVGSLAQAIEEKIKEDICFPETEVKRMLLHVALGLRHIHSLNLAHLDIKPGNIFITRSRLPGSPNASDSGFEEDDKFQIDDGLIYKIGDLGHVVSTSETESVEEGDCRYMAPELLLENYKCLPKADIFALGLTAYEMCSRKPLKENGDEWQTIRKGYLPNLPNYSEQLNKLLKEMIRPDPEQRPSSLALENHQTLVPYASKTKEQLNRELTVEKHKNELLSKQLREAQQNVLNQKLNVGRLKRVIGGKVNRSHSVTNF